MKTVKVSLKPSASRTLVMLLLAANLVAYIFTSRFFTSQNLAQNGQEEKPGIISQMYTGWQMLDMSFSLIDYFNNVGDRKN